MAQETLGGSESNGEEQFVMKDSRAIERENEGKLRLRQADAWVNGAWETLVGAGRELRTAASDAARVFVDGAKDYLGDSEGSEPLAEAGSYFFAGLKDYVSQRASIVENEGGRSQLTPDQVQRIHDVADRAIASMQPENPSRFEATIPPAGTDSSN